MNQAYMRIHGKRSLMPKRKEPMPDQVIQGFYGLPAGQRFGAMRARPDDHNFQTFLDAVSTLEDTGLRKAELIRQQEDLYMRCLDWSDVAFLCRKGKITTTPTRKQLRKMDTTCCVVITPTVSKCDATGEHWGNNPIPLPWENDERNSAFRLVRRYQRLRIDCYSDGQPARQSRTLRRRTGQSLHGWRLRSNAQSCCPARVSRDRQSGMEQNSVLALLPHSTRHPPQVSGSARRAHSSVLQVANARIFAHIRPQRLERIRKMAQEGAPANGGDSSGCQPPGAGALSPT